MVASMFTEDYAHFERSHAQFPSQAGAVFQCMDMLRAALAQFRLDTEEAAEPPPVQLVVDNVLRFKDEQQVDAPSNILRFKNEEALEETLTETLECTAAP